MVGLDTLVPVLIPIVASYQGRSKAVTDVLHKKTQSQMLLIRFCCCCSLNTKQHGVKKCYMAKAISGHSAPQSGMAMVIAAIPVTPPICIARERRF